LIKCKEEEIIFSNMNNRILLEFHKPKDKNDNHEHCFSRKLVLGNCKLMDPKSEKNATYEIMMPVNKSSSDKDKDGKDSNYFVCDNLKGQINSGQELVISFTFKPP
jgi:hypothetical protein